MIEKRFFHCPHIMWITLWATGPCHAQVLDFSGLRRRCIISRQAHAFNKINDLASIRINPDGPLQRAGRAAVQHDFWG
jgi:hypothetical protein